MVCCHTCCWFPPTAAQSWEYLPRTGRQSNRDFGCIERTPSTRHLQHGNRNSTICVPTTSVWPVIFFQSYCKTVHFRRILISRFRNVEILLHFNLAFPHSVPLVFTGPLMGKLNFLRVFNFVILSYSRNSWLRTTLVSTAKVMCCIRSLIIIIIIIIIIFFAPASTRPAG